MEEHARLHGEAEERAREIAELRSESNRSDISDTVRENLRGEVAQLEDANKVTLRKLHESREHVRLFEDDLKERKAQEMEIAREFHALVMITGAFHDGEEE